MTAPVSELSFNTDMNLFTLLYAAFGKITNTKQRQTENFIFSLLYRAF